jgi:hypothetical protein
MSCYFQTDGHVIYLNLIKGMNTRMWVTIDLSDLSTATYEVWPLKSIGHDFNEVHAVKECTSS